MWLGAALTIAWFLGGIPFGLLLVRAWKGVDIRALGSGNVGATNASRAFAGRARLPVFLAIYVLDFGKGFVPACFFPEWFGLEPTVGHSVAIGAAAIVGHCASPFLRLRGGKGVATTTGMFAAVEPLALLLALMAFGLVAKLSGRVFWGSLALGFALALAVPLRDPETAFGSRWPATLAAALAALFLVFTHRSNLRLALGKSPAADP